MRMTPTQIILGIGSLITFFGVIAMAAAGPLLTEMFGAGLLMVPVIGVTTTFGSLFYVYRNRRLDRKAILWISALGVLWFVLLPIFWYRKVGVVNRKAT